MKQLFDEIIVPQAVYEELARIEKQKEIIDAADWIHVKKVMSTDTVASLSESIDRGEAEAISLALEMDATLLVIDEKLGRSVAKQHNLKIIGLLGLLIIAKDRKLISHVRPIANDLIQIARFRINKKLINKVLRSVGE